MKIIKSKEFLVGAIVFLLISIPITTYLVIKSEQTSRSPQAATVCELNCVSEDTQNSTSEKLKEDLNSDGLVNGADLSLVLSVIGKSGETAADLNNDGQVDESDVVLIKAKWSK